MFELTFNDEVKAFKNFAEHFLGQADFNDAVQMHHIIPSAIANKIVVSRLG